MPIERHFDVRRDGLLFRLFIMMPTTSGMAMAEAQSCVFEKRLGAASNRPPSALLPYLQRTRGVCPTLGGTMSSSWGMGKTQLLSPLNLVTMRVPL